MPKTTKPKKPRSPLERYLITSGRTLREVANELGYTENHLGEIKRGHRKPTPWLRGQLQLHYQISARSW